MKVSPKNPKTLNCIIIFFSPPLQTIPHAVHPPSGPVGPSPPYGAPGQSGAVRYTDHFYLVMDVVTSQTCRECLH